MLIVTKCTTIIPSSLCGRAAFKLFGRAERPWLCHQRTCTRHVALSPGVKQDLNQSGIGLEEYQARRKALARRVITQPSSAAVDHHVIVIPAAARSHMAEGIPYVFRQNSDFRYLTGFRETDGVFVMEVTAAGDMRTTVFVKEQTPEEALWEGARVDVTQACSVMAAEDAQPLGRLSELLTKWLSQSTSSKLWYANDKAVNAAIHKSHMEAVLSAAKRYETPALHLHELRLLKSPSELALMAESGRIASASFAKAVEFSRKHRSEPAIFAKIDFECRMRGADFLAYLPVVAGGPRSTTIHYIANEKHLDECDMVLLDAGCDYRGYVSDITRTWPVSGSFTSAQQAVYEAVLEVQQHCLGLCQAGNTLNNIHAAMMALIAKQLVRLGVIKSSASPRARSAMTEKICPHHVGHYLGLDVHDTPTISRSRPLLPSTVITIEPGMYFQPAADYVPKEFRGLGVRIEDDVVITSDGPRVLTESCPKSCSELLACLARGLVTGVVSAQ